MPRSNPKLLGWNKPVKGVTRGYFLRPLSGIDPWYTITRVSMGYGGFYFTVDRGSEYLGQAGTLYLAEQLAEGDAANLVRNAQSGGLRYNGKGKRKPTERQHFERADRLYRSVRSGRMSRFDFVDQLGPKARGSLGHSAARTLEDERATGRSRPRAVSLARELASLDYAGGAHHNPGTVWGVAWYTTKGQGYGGYQTRLIGPCATAAACRAENRKEAAIYHQPAGSFHTFASHAEALNAADRGRPPGKVRNPAFVWSDGTTTSTKSVGARSKIVVTNVRRYVERAGVWEGPGWYAYIVYDGTDFLGKLGPYSKRETAKKHATRTWRGWGE